MIRDNSDEIVEQLTAIRSLLGGGNLGSDVDLTSVKAPRHALTPGAYVVTETADMDYSNDDGTVTIEPGDSYPLVRYEATSTNGVMLLAVGATDEQDVEFYVEIDNRRVVGGRTNSPLGNLNSPFSFVEKLGGSIPAEHTVTYWAAVSPDAAGPVSLAARMHVEEATE